MEWWKEEKLESVTVQIHRTEDELQHVTLDVFSYSGLPTWSRIWFPSDPDIQTQTHFNTTTTNQCKENQA